MLLLKAQLLALVGAVIRVQYAGQGLCTLPREDSLATPDHIVSLCIADDPLWLIVLPCGWGGCLKNRWAIRCNAWMRPISDSLWLGSPPAQRFGQLLASSGLPIGLPRHCEHNLDTCHNRTSVCGIVTAGLYHELKNYFAAAYK